MFKQSATGSFTVPIVGDWHCGPDATSPKTFPYRVTAEYPDTALDAHGFLLDNTAFSAYFAEIGRTPVSESCELLCKRIARELATMAGHRASQVTARVWALEGVYIEYVYTPYTNGKLDSGSFGDQ
jgi:hypothetical protein